MIVRLNSGVDYRGASTRCRCELIRGGILSCLDGYMNVRRRALRYDAFACTMADAGCAQIAMEETEELVNGVVKNAFGDAFIRGNNGAGDALPCALTRQ